MDTLMTLTPWHWVALGFFVLILEVLGAGGFLLGIGFGAILVAILVSVVDLSWQTELVLFSILSIVSTIVYWKYFRANNTVTEDPLLNNKAARLVGKRAVVIEPIEGGTGKVQIHDALWSASADSNINEGVTVKITDYNKMTLQVTPI